MRRIRTLLDADADRAEVLVDDQAANVAAARKSGFNAGIYDLATGVEGMRTLLARHDLAEVIT